LQSTALVNEAFIRLAGKNLAIENRSHFLALSARAMRMVLWMKSEVAAEPSVVPSSIVLSDTNSSLLTIYRTKKFFEHRRMS
jgi:hypothetical protein